MHCALKTKVLEVEIRRIEKEPATLHGWTLPYRIVYPTYREGTRYYVDCFSDDRYSDTRLPVCASSRAVSVPVGGLEEDS